MPLNAPKAYTLGAGRGTHLYKGQGGAGVRKSVKMMCRGIRANLVRILARLVCIPSEAGVYVAAPFC